MSGIRYDVPVTAQTPRPLDDPTSVTDSVAYRGPQSTFPSKSRRTRRSGDGRTGVNHGQEASSTPTFLTRSRLGCHLRIPSRLLGDSAGTMTRDEYYAWLEDDA